MGGFFFFFTKVRHCEINGEISINIIIPFNKEQKTVYTVIKITTY